MEHLAMDEDHHIGKDETVIQFKVGENSLTIWKRKYKERVYSYRVCCINMDRRDSDAGLGGGSNVDENQDSTNIADIESNTSSYVEISVLNDKEHNFTKQEQFGRIYIPNEYVMLQAKTHDPEKLTFMVDFYVHDKVFNNPLVIPEHIGFCYILPSNMPESYGTCTMPITGNKRQPIGQLSVEYLIIRPLKGRSESIIHYNDTNWFRGKGGLDVGHRGAGNARRSDKVENVLENTVASFNYAAAHGADMVELDVQLTKDLVPVIYHDFYINIALKKKKVLEDEPLQVAVKDLTLQQLQMLKLSPVHDPNHKEKYDFLDDDPQENQPFPTLQHVLEAVNLSCGFNIEVKYPMLRRDGIWDGAVDKLYDINDYVDMILKTVLDYGGNRKIIFSCFHPDVCSMIQLKQSKYPLLFLTQGQTEKYPAYLDPRTNSVHMAAYFAKSQKFLGINTHAEELLRDRNLLYVLKEMELVVFCWGDDLNSSSVIKQLKADGVDGIIYDKVDEYTVNQLFVPQARDARKTLLEAITGTVEHGGSWASTNSSQ